MSRNDPLTDREIIENRHDCNLKRMVHQQKCVTESDMKINSKNLDNDSHYKELQLHDKLVFFPIAMHEFNDLAQLFICRVLHTFNHLIGWS